MRFFRELRMMIFSILGCLKALVWVCIVLFGTFFLFSVSFVAATTENLDTAEKWQDPENHDLITWFGSLDEAILALFMAMSGGNDWGLYFDALRLLPVQYCFLFIAFILFSIFAVFNV